MSDTIGDDYVHEPSQLIKLLDFVDNEEIQNRFLAIKQERKQILIDYIKSELDIEVPLDSIIDTQAKRLHALQASAFKCATYHVFDSDDS